MNHQSFERKLRSLAYALEHTSLTIEPKQTVRPLQLSASVIVLAYCDVMHLARRSINTDMSVNLLVELSLEIANRCRRDTIYHVYVMRYACVSTVTLIHNYRCQMK